VRHYYADRMARFCFPELRLGLIPGFGGIPRLKRDLGTGGARLAHDGTQLQRDEAQQVGLVSQIAAEGEACDWRGPLLHKSGNLIGGRRLRQGVCEADSV